MSTINLMRTHFFMFFLVNKISFFICGFQAKNHQNEIFLEIMKLKFLIQEIASAFGEGWIWHILGKKEFNAIIFHFSRTENWTIIFEKFRQNQMGKHQFLKFRADSVTIWSDPAVYLWFKQNFSKQNKATLLFEAP